MVWLMKSDTVETTYRVTVDDKAEEWHCNCPARVTCKHIRRCIEALAFGMRAMYHEED